MRIKLQTPLKILSLLSALTVLQPVTAETLSEAVTTTMQSNPGVLAEVNRSHSVDATVRQAESGYYPKADLNLGIGREWTENRSTRPGHETLTRGEAGLSASQMLYDGFATKNAVDQASSAAESARYSVTDTAETTALNAVKVYLDVLRYQQLQTLTQENLDSHQRIFSLIQKRTESGVGTRADLDQSTGRVALANANNASSKGNLDDAISRYQRVIGHSPEELQDPGEDCCQQAPATVEDAINIAFSQHPALRSAIAEHEASLAQQQGAEAPFHPRVDLDLSTRADNNLDGSQGHEKEMQAMVRMQYNLLNGGADKARLQETGYLSEEAKTRAEIVKRELENEVRLAWNALSKSTARLPILQQRVEAATKTREAYQQQFNIGQRSLLDLLDTENELLSSSLDYTNLYYERIYDCFWLLETMGQLLESMNISAPEQGLAVASPVN